MNGQQIDNTQECADSTYIPASSIRAIDKSTVHRICSGQVVLTLAIAVKELVENSLDAGGTFIEIKLKDHGSTLIEVSDNGNGVEPCDFSGLTLKHHTSKIENFGDVVGVKTFGFRGEALSSLCALSNVTILTRHHKQDVGTKLVYNNTGKLIEVSTLARNVGTTVLLENIFYTLPVRRKEFLRNLKKEFNKMVQILYSYCLISNHVRIQCINQCDKGKKSTVLSTDVHSSMKDRISSLFGVKQVSSLLEIKQREANSDFLQEYGISLDINNIPDNVFSLKGFISSCEHGRGRSAADRQFYFINSRPCDPVKVSRIVNEVYHHYNKNQFPVVVLNICMNENDVDINVTPDKRQILVNREKLLLAIIKTTLMCLYENIPATYNMKDLVFGNNCAKTAAVSLQKTSHLSEKFSRSPSLSERFAHSTSNGSIKSNMTFSGIKRSITSVTEDVNGSNKQPKLYDFAFSSVKNLSKDNSTNDSGESESLGFQDSENKTSSFDSVIKSTKQKVTNFESTQKKIQNETNFNSESIKKLKNETYFNSESTKTLKNETYFNSESTKSLQNETDFNFESTEQAIENEIVNNSENYSCISNTEHNVKTDRKPLEDIESVVNKENVTPKRYSQAQGRTNDFINNLLIKRKSLTPQAKKETTVRQKYEMEKYTNESDDELEVEIVNDYSVSPCTESSLIPDNKIIVEEIDKMDTVCAKMNSITIDFSMEILNEKLKIKRHLLNSNKNMARKFRATISPTDNKTAEDELKKEISKDMFKKMEILGQFNLGFIIARLESDLFIIDQHATDEKYNFETLQNTVIMQNQKLIIPQQLQLTSVNESILIDNMNIFTRNGFEFKIDENQPLGRRVYLTSIPHSKGWEFGKEDIEEMIFMLSDSPDVFCRPSRLRAMFASRACRKSIMIGTPLSKVQMRTLVDHMSDIEQPWNCPHGRPTMRHLINLNLLSGNT